MKPFFTIYLAMVGLLIALLCANWIWACSHELIAQWRSRRNAKRSKQRREQEWAKLLGVSSRKELN